MGGGGEGQGSGGERGSVASQSKPGEGGEEWRVPQSQPGGRGGGNPVPAGEGGVPMSWSGVPHSLVLRTRAVKKKQPQMNGLTAPGDMIASLVSLLSLPSGEIIHLT